MPRLTRQAWPVRAVPTGQATTHGQSRQVGNPAGVGGSGATAGPSVVPTSAIVTWSPLVRQVVEPDTLYLLDGAAERTYAAAGPGLGGLQFGVNYAPDTPFALVTTPAGKYRAGIKTTNPGPDKGSAWMPCLGLIDPNEFTIEAWFCADSDWASIVREIPLEFHGTTAALKIVFYGSAVMLVGPTDAMTIVSYPVTVGQFVAGTYYSVAATLLAGTATMYVGGAPVARATGVPRLPPIHDVGYDDGLMFKGHYQGVESSSHAWLSDLRISHRARTPGAPLTVSNATTITISPHSQTGPVVTYSLPGELFGPRTPATPAVTQRDACVRAQRCDHFMDATPMKAGATDATHPTPGHSGAYSYDWTTLVDPAATYCKAHGQSLHLDFAFTPSILGGASPPGVSGENATPPSSYDAFTTICTDLVYHIYNEIGLTALSCSLWNEPTGTYWSGTSGDPTVAPASQPLTGPNASYLGLYGKVMPAIKSMFPSVQVGGPEDNPTTLNATIDFCANFGLPLDYVSYHDYSGDLGRATAVRAAVDARRASKGQPAGLPLSITEFNWNDSNLGATVWRNYDYFRNDFAAAHLAATMMTCQQVGIQRLYYTFGIQSDGGNGYAALSLQTYAHGWASRNVYEMWGRLAPYLISAVQDTNGRPDIYCQASTDAATGRVTVLLAQRRYRKDGDTPVILSFSGWTPTAVTQQVIDDGHSNWADTNGLTDSLQSVAAPAIVGNAVTITMRPRSVVLLTLSGH